VAAVNGSVDGVKYFPNTVNFDEREMQVRVFYSFGKEKNCCYFEHFQIHFVILR
jgi:hypothetical protein